MVGQAQETHSILRPVSHRESGTLPARARGNRGNSKHQQHYSKGECGGMIRAFRLYTGSDGNSHVERGSVSGGDLVKAESILFKETPPHSSFDWHNDPIPQYVITLAGVLEFSTEGGETFTIHPGDVLLAVDHTGSGHKWRLT